MNTQNQTATIVSVQNETPRVKTFILDVSIKSKPGQYVMVWIPGVNEKPFGVVTPSPLTLSIAKVGQFTEQIHLLKKGDNITFRGPYGTPFRIKRGKTLLVAGGYGGVPLYHLACSLSQSSRNNCTVILGARTREELLFEKKFRALGCEIKVATDDGSKGFKGYAPQLAEELIREKKYSAVYTCGPEIMMKKIAEIAHKNKLFCQVSLERLFKCGGFGICGECSCKGKLVCKDGPVFTSSILL